MTTDKQAPDYEEILHWLDFNNYDFHVHADVADSMAEGALAILGLMRLVAELKAELDINLVFYNLTVQQRNTAWREIDDLRGEVL